MSVFPQVLIGADRLDVREFGWRDADAVRAVLNEPEALPPGAPEDPATIDAWLSDGVHLLRRSGQGVHLGMFDRGSGQLVGAISLFRADWEVRSAEIGYGVRPGRRRQGYATEALTAASRWALTTGGLQRVWLTVNVDNVASVRVAVNAGFTLEGTLRRSAAEPDGLHDQHLFALLDDEIQVSGK
ncbi:MAG: GNAT family protein [Streptosporangiaceae bacterium]